MEILLSAKNISKTFQGRRVLDNIDIEINTGDEIEMNLIEGEVQLVVTERRV